MAELPRQSSNRRWRRADRVVLIACAFFAVFEVAVLFALEAVVAGAMA